MTQFLYLHYEHFTFNNCCVFFSDFGFQSGLGRGGAFSNSSQYAGNYAYPYQYGMSLDWWMDGCWVVGWMDDGWMDG